MRAMEHVETQPLRGLHVGVALRQPHAQAPDASENGSGGWGGGRGDGRGEAHVTMPMGWSCPDNARAAHS